MKLPRLIVIAAPSGAGKTTLCDKLLREFEGELVLSISSTTRPPRGAEKHAREYFFLSAPEFEQAVAAGRFAEWARVHGNYYGTSKDVLEASFQAGKSVLLDIDVQGAHSLAQSFPDRCVRIFIAPPNLEALEARLRARATETEESIARRMRNAREEMARQHEFDRIIVNDDLDRAYAELKALVAEKLR